MDSAAAGHDLAARYPDLGMTGELIAKAIGRAETMMRAVQNGEAVEPSGDDLAPPVEVAALFAAPAETTDAAAPEVSLDRPEPADAMPPAQCFAEVPVGLFRRAARA